MSRSPEEPRAEGLAGEDIREILATAHSVSDRVRRRAGAESRQVARAALAETAGAAEAIARAAGELDHLAAHLRSTLARLEALLDDPAERAPTPPSRAQPGPAPARRPTGRASMRDSGLRELFEDTAIQITAARGEPSAGAEPPPAVAPPTVRRRPGLRASWLGRALA